MLCLLLNSLRDRILTWRLCLLRTYHTEVQLLAVRNLTATRCAIGSQKKCIDIYDKPWYFLTLFREGLSTSHFGGGVCNFAHSYRTTGDTELKLYMAIDLHKLFPKIEKKLG